MWDPPCTVHQGSPVWSAEQETGAKCAVPQWKAEQILSGPYSYSVRGGKVHKLDDSKQQRTWNHWNSNSNSYVLFREKDAKVILRFSVYSENDLIRVRRKWWGLLQGSTCFHSVASHESRRQKKFVFLSMCLLVSPIWSRMASIRLLRQGKIPRTWAEPRSIRDGNDTLASCRWTCSSSEQQMRAWQVCIFSGFISLRTLVNESLHLCSTPSATAHGSWMLSALNKTSEAENTDVCRDVFVLCLQKTMQVLGVCRIVKLFVTLRMVWQKKKKNVKISFLNAVFYDVLLQGRKTQSLASL